MTVAVLCAACADTADPDRMREGRLAISPVAATSPTSLVDIAAARIRLSRIGATEPFLDTTVAVSPEQSEFDLTLTVPIKGASETLLLSLVLLDLDGGEVYRDQGDPTTITVSASTETDPIDVPIEYIGPGATATRLEITEEAVFLSPGGAVQLEAVAYDEANQVIGDAPIGWLALDALVTLDDLTSGLVQAGTQTGSARVMAMLPRVREGVPLVSDTAIVTVIEQAPALVSGRVLDAVSGSGIAGAGIDVTQGGATVLTALTDANGAFELTLDAGTYDLDVDATGYTPTTYQGLSVTAGAPLQLEPILLVPLSPEPGAIAGVVRDALTGLGIAAADVALRAGINATTGTPVATVTTDGTGSYRIEGVDAGTYTVTATASGYTEGFRTGIVVGASEIFNQDVTLSPVGSGDVVRIVLTWGASPSDLDSHLTGPLALGGRFHVYYAAEGSLTAAPWAALDLDDTASFGPETITIVQYVAGVYRYSVHDYSNRGATTSTALSTSGARVDVYRGAELLRSFFPPGQDGTLWTVFELDGTSLTLTPVGTMSYESDSGAITAPGEHGTGVLLPQKK
jgi:hypothetical protein